jgi:hypothetical protein
MKKKDKLPSGQVLFSDGRKEKFRGCVDYVVSYPE